MEFVCRFLSLFANFWLLGELGDEASYCNRRKIEGINAQSKCRPGACRGGFDGTKRSSVACLPRYQSGERMGKWSCATDDGNANAHVQSRSTKAAPPMRERELRLVRGS